MEFWQVILLMFPNYYYNYYYNNYLLILLLLLLFLYLLILFIYLFIFVSFRWNGSWQGKKHFVSLFSYLCCSDTANDFLICLFDGIKEFNWPFPSYRPYGVRKWFNASDAHLLTCLQHAAFYLGIRVRSMVAFEHGCYLRWRSDKKKKD
jgi:hypothetical protein